MFNDLFNIWITMIIILIAINIVIRIYKWFCFSYLFSVSVGRFINVNNVNLISYFNFKNIYASNFIKWRSKESYIKMLNIVLYLIYNESYFVNLFLSNKLCLVVFEVNPNKSEIPLADPIIINYNDQLSGNELFNRIKWNNRAFSNHGDIKIIIKII